MKAHANRRNRNVGWLTGWAGVLVLAAAAGCGSATSGGGATGGSAGRLPVTSTADTHRGFVSAGNVLRSDHFQMISAVGPTSIAGQSSSSARTRLRSGLVPNMTE